MGAWRCKRGPGYANGAQDVKVRAGTCERRVWHISGAQDVWMGAETCKRGPGHKKGGREVGCMGGRGQGCVGMVQGMGTRHRMTVGGLGGSG